MNKKEMWRVIQQHNKRYYVDSKPTISDEVYDNLVNEYIERYGEVPGNVEPTIPENKVEHRERMYSLEKTYDYETIVRRFSGKEVIIQPKVDGIAIEMIMRYKFSEEGDCMVPILAVTRGDGLYGMDVTENLKHLQLPKDSWVTSYGELYLPVTDGNVTRNIVSGIVRNTKQKSPLLNDLKFYHHETGTGITTIVDNINKLKSEVSTVIQWAKNHKIPIDGVVIKLSNGDEYRKAGFTKKYPKGAIAFKFKGECKLTTVTNVELSIAETGRVTPVAHIKPVEFNGRTITSVSLSSYNNHVNKFPVTKGSLVEVAMAGDVIPKISSVVDLKHSDMNVKDMYDKYDIRGKHAYTVESR